MAPPPRPWVTYGLIAANVLALAAAALGGLSLIQPDAMRLFELGGNWGPRTLGGEPWRLVTATFLHAGLLHLSMNMIALHDGGRQIEAIYGRAGMGAIYATAGLVGALASALRNGPVSVGASGAVFGLFGAFGGFLFRHRDRLDPVAVRAAGRGLLILVGLNVMIGVSVPGIDQFAHVGGALGGVAAGWAIERLPRGWRLSRRALVVGLAAVALVGTATVVAPKPEPALPVVVADFHAADEAAVERLFDLYQDSGLTAAQKADIVEREVLAPYHLARRALEDGALDEGWSRLRRIAARREDALIAMVAAWRADDAAAFQAAHDAWNAAVDER